MATNRWWSMSLLLVQLLLCWSALTIDETVTTASQGEDNDHRVFNRDQILYPTTAEDLSNAADDQRVLQLLATIYASSIRPAERQSHYTSLGIGRSTLTETTILAKPNVLLVGPWSSGKTTTINYLLGGHNNDRLPSGAEPTTSHFTVINYGERAGQTDGPILAADPAHPLTQLEQLGQRALQHVTELQLTHRLLANLTLVDTPGMFENQAQRERGYPYDAVLGWFADRADLIVVMFDPARVEIGHEMTQLFGRLGGRHASVRIVLNKADSIDEEQLMRVYGALLWSLSPLVNATEPPRVYLSSLWSRPHRGQPAFKRLLELDEHALLNDIRFTIEDGVRNKIALVRQQALRVRMHYIMVDAIVEAYRRYKGTNEQQNRQLLADMIANPTKYGILKAAMARANGLYEAPDASEYSTYFRAISIDDHLTTDELCAKDRHCAFLELQGAIDIRLTDLIRGYKAGKKIAVSSDSDELTDGENDNEDVAEALPSNTEAVAEVSVQPADIDEPQEETDAHSHQEDEIDNDENASSNTEESSGNKTEDEWTSEKNAYTPEKPSGYVREASGSFLFAEAAASDPTRDRKKKRQDKESEEEEIEADSDDKHEVSDKLRCHYRKSCYSTGEVPKLRPHVFGDPIFVKAQEEPEKKEEEEDEEQSEKQMKLRCHYRKSCYETGAVPDLSSKPPVPVKHVEPDIEDHPTQSLEARCRYRKSCYETGKLPEELEAASVPEKKEKEGHHKKEKHSKDKHDKQSAPKAAGHSDSESTRSKKHHKSHRTEQPKTKKRDEQRNEKRSAVKEPELVEVATLPANVMKLQCRYRYSCYRTGVIAENVANAEADEVDTSATDAHDEELDEDEIKLRCRYRKSCYGSYGLDVKLDDTDYEQVAEHETVVLEEAQKARLQLVAKWILHTLKEAEAEAQERPRPVATATPITELNEKLDAKIRCRYRKSCYETGVAPQLEPQITLIPSFEIPDDRKDDEETEEDEIDVKLRCRYRKSCYETGILPDLGKEAAEAAAVKQAQAEEEAAALVNHYTTPQLRCRYRKSCYETGELPEKFFAAPEPEKEEDSIADRIFTEAIPTTITNVKLFCRYRKSCYQRAAEMQLLQPEEQAKLPEKGSNPSDDDEEQDPAELKPCKPYQRKNCIKVEEVENTEPTVESEVDESESEVKELKPCKPYQRKNCIKVDENEAAEAPRVVVAANVETEDSSEEEENADSGEEQPSIHSPDQNESDEQESGEGKDEQEDEDKSKESDGDIEVDDDAQKEEKDGESGEGAGESEEEEEEKEETVEEPESELLVVPIPKSEKNEETAPKEKPKAKPVVSDFVKHSKGYEEEKEEVQVHPGTKRDASMKLACKYKISCYKKAGIDYKKTEKDTLPAEASRSHVAQLLISEEEADKMKAAIVLGQLARDQATRRTKCHYRKSCYETGIVTEPDADKAAEEKAVRNVLEELEDTEDEDENKLLIKLRCHYRKSCYETGIIPDLTPPEPLLKTNQQLIVESGDPTVELKCKYRKSCYESGGQVPASIPSKTDFTAPPPTTDFTPSMRPKTVNDMKLLCHYRKSCYDKFDLEEDDDGKSVDEQADKKSPPHPSATPKEAGGETAAPYAAADEIGQCTKPYQKSCQQASVKPTPEQKTVSPAAAKGAAPILVDADGGRCHKFRYRLSCREQLGLPPKEKVPIGPNGKKLCRKKPKSS